MIRWFSLLSFLFCLVLPAQDTTNTPILIKPNTPAEEEKSDDSSATNASVFNQGSARTMAISVPAPRGLILDRKGRPLAQTKMAYHLALDFTAYRESGGIEGAVAWAKGLIATATLVKGKQSYSDEKLSKYYRNRRWLPKKISKVLTESTAKSLENKLLPDSLFFRFIYVTTPRRASGPTSSATLGPRLSFLTALSMTATRFSSPPWARPDLRRSSMTSSPAPLA